ncbi:MAG: capsular biosynthesis protein [Acidobacteria bacterium]|nr:MAG: capsular biosynthesis protein [Acidobacteriota bacterium]
MMVDLHCHVLPAIDDGSESLEQSLEFCRVALEDGVSTLVATPHQKPGHYDNTPPGVHQKVEELKSAVHQAGLEVEIVEGAEVYCTPDLPQRLREREVTTINAAGRYLLLELPYQQMPLRPEETIFQLKLAGVTPVLAHPERIAYFVADMKRLENLVRLGCLTQLTGASLLGGFGERARDYSVEMLERGLVHIIASDAHDTVYRPPVLSKAREVAAEVVGAARALAMVSEVPRAVCEGHEWEPWELPADPPPEPQGFLERLRGLLRGKD